MNRSDVLRILREHESVLKADGIAHLRLFGSVAREEAATHSDIDLMVEFDGSKHLTLVTLGHLQAHLSELLGETVDLSIADSLKEPVAMQAQHEALLAF